MYIQKNCLEFSSILKWDFWIVGTSTPMSENKFSILRFILIIFVQLRILACLLITSSSTHKTFSNCFKTIVIFFLNFYNIELGSSTLTVRDSSFECKMFASLE